MTQMMVDLTQAVNPCPDWDWLPFVCTGGDWSF